MQSISHHPPTLPRITSHSQLVCLVRLAAPRVRTQYPRASAFVDARNLASRLVAASLFLLSDAYCLSRLIGFDPRLARWQRRRTCSLRTFATCNSGLSVPSFSLTASSGLCPPFSHSSSLNSPSGRFRSLLSFVPRVHALSLSSPPARIPPSYLPSFALAAPDVKRQPVTHHLSSPTSDCSAKRGCTRPWYAAITVRSSVDARDGNVRT